tara:strand:+ start:2030 stop:2404 length:375 start_codon:yes stop_codon:yes gene_type:complete
VLSYFLAYKEAEMDERRRYQRYQLDQEVSCEVLSGEGTSYKAYLYDISSNGARLKFEENQYPYEMAVGDVVNVYNYSQGGDYIDERMTAQAVWYSDSYYGIEYDGSIVKTMDKLLKAYPTAKPI